MFRKIIAKILKNEFVHGGVILTVANFITGFFNYIANFLTGRALGPSLYSEVATLSSYLFILSIPITILSTLVIQKISSSSNRQIFALSLEAFLLQKLRKWWIFILLTLLITPVVPSITNLSSVAAYSLIPVSLFIFLGTFYNSSFLALRNFYLFSLISILTSLVRVIGASIAYVGIGGLNTIIIFIVLSSLFFMAASYIGFKKSEKNKPKKEKLINFNKRLIHLLLNYQVRLYASSTLAFTLYNNIDVIFVKKFFSSFDAGIYASWSLFAKIIVYFLTPLASISFIFFSSRIKKNVQNVVLLITLLGTLVGAILGYLFYTTLGPRLIVLFYGEKFISVTPLLGQASIFGFLYITLMFINGYFMAKNSRYGYIFALSLPVYIAGLFFVPHNLSSFINYLIYFIGVITAIYTAIYFITQFLDRKSF